MLREELDHYFLAQNSDNLVAWRISKNIINYNIALEYMKNYVKQINEQKKDELIWLLEHPPLYTAGTSAKKEDLLGGYDFPIYNIGRGGQYTYHGPGQRLTYIMLDLKRRKCDVRSFISAIEEWIIKSLDYFAIKGERRENRVGIWVTTAEGEKKIAAIGLRLYKWISYHGMAINFNANLNHFKGINPCGLSEYGVINIKDLAPEVTIQDLDISLRVNFEKIFGKNYDG